MPVSTGEPDVMEWVRGQLADQGIPEDITDPAMLARLVALLRPRLATR